MWLASIQLKIFLGNPSSWFTILLTSLTTLPLAVYITLSSRHRIWRYSMIIWSSRMEYGEFCFQSPFPIDNFIISCSPMWEDDINKNGGRWVMFLDKDSKDFVDKLWHDLVSLQVCSQILISSHDSIYSFCVQLANVLNTQNRSVELSSMSAIRPARYVWEYTIYMYIYSNPSLNCSSLDQGRLQPAGHTGYWAKNEASAAAERGRATVSGA